MQDDPLTRESASRMIDSGVSRFDRAMSGTITSVSVVDEKIDPSFSISASQLDHIGEVAVVGGRDLSYPAVDEDGLGIADIRRPGGGIPVMADGARSLEIVNRGLMLKDLVHQPHRLVHADRSLVRHRDARAFLAPV